VSTNSTPQASTTILKVLAVLLAVMTGITAALAAFILGEHLTAETAEAVVWAATTFVATTGLALLIEEKTGLLD
jgi:hypothetical protein